MSGPEVIETAAGVEEFDSRDRALVWRTTGGKHRYLLGDCQVIVPDSIEAFRNAAFDAMRSVHAEGAALTLDGLQAESDMLERRLADFGTRTDPVEIWSDLGIPAASTLPMLDADAFRVVADIYRIGRQA
jgi:malonate decarboxylase beta subunit